MPTDTSASTSALTLLSEEEMMFRDAIAAFADEEVRPRVAEMEKAGRIDPGLLPKYFDLGLMGIEVPEQYGGAGGTLFMVTLAVEEISKVDAAAAIVCDVQNTLVNYPIAAYGTEAQKSKYLPMLNSSVVGAYALSESGSPEPGRAASEPSAWAPAPLPQRRLGLRGWRCRPAAPRRIGSELTC